MIISSDKNSIKKGIIGAIFLTIAAFFWGTTFVAQKIAGAYQGVFTFCSLRNILAAFLLTPVVFVYEKRLADSGVPETAKYVADVGIQDVASSRLEQLDVNKDNRQVITGGIITGIFLAGTAVFQQMGIQMGTGAGKAGFLTSFYIVLVPVIGIFLGKKCFKTV